MNSSFHCSIRNDRNTDAVGIKEDSMEVLSGLPFLSNNVVTFLWGFFGNLSVEIVNLCHHYDSKTPVPSHYQHLHFWILRLMMASVGGSLAIAMGIESNAMMSVYVGASAHLIIQKFSKGQKLNEHAVD
jgi:hypothetical protein